MMSAAWHGAYFGRVKDFPELRKFLLSERVKMKQAQSPETMIGHMRAWVSATRH